jgi:large subunit ribosomal protein L4
LLDTLLPQEAKTAYLDKQLDVLFPDAPRRSVLMIDTGKDSQDGGERLRRAAANLTWVDVLPNVGLNVYSILQRDQLVLSVAALDAIVQRLRQPIKRM